MAASKAQDQTGWNKWWQQRRPSTQSVIFAVGSALLSVIFIIYFFSPHYVFWRALDVPTAWTYPELFREHHVWQQVQNPALRYDRPEVQVLNWRLLFPYLGHYLHLPRPLFLALPHLGCLLALGVMARLLYREFGTKRAAFCAATALGANSWFFVSTGWLGYFDSWYILSMLGVIFGRAKWILMAAGLLSPWVDERFVLTLPLCLLARAAFFDQFNREHWREILLDSMLCALGSCIYLAIRIIAGLNGGAADWHNYFAGNMLVSFGSDGWRVAKGIWMGLRGVWIFVIILGWMAVARLKFFWGWAMVIVLAATFIINLLLAADLSRSMSVLMPAAMTGMILLYRHRAELSRRLIYTVFFINLFLPANNVVTKFDNPIFSFYGEMYWWKNPPAFMDPEYHVAQARNYMTSNQPDKEYDALNEALLVAPRNWPKREKIEARMRALEKAAKEKK